MRTKTKIVKRARKIVKSRNIPLRPSNTTTDEALMDLPVARINLPADEDLPAPMGPPANTDSPDTRMDSPADEDLSAPMVTPADDFRQVLVVSVDKI